MNRQDAKDAKEIESLEKVVVGALLHASPPGHGGRSVRSVRSVRSLSKSKSKSKSGSIPALVGAWPLSPPNCPAELRQHRNNTVAVPGFSCPNPFDTDSDTDPDPDPASPWTYSDDRKVGLQERIIPKNPPKRYGSEHGPTHPHGQVETATAPSAGSSPGPDGDARLGKRLPFRTSSGWGPIPLICSRSSPSCPAGPQSC
jgi:hypothetical protein